MLHLRCSEKKNKIQKGKWNLELHLTKMQKKIFLGVNISKKKPKYKV